MEDVKENFMEKLGEGLSLTLFKFVIYVNKKKYISSFLSLS